MALLEVREVSHRFGGNVALDRVSITADEGAITGMIGPNGAGKSTLFAVVTGALTPSSGRITLAGHDLEHCPPHRRARLGIGRTFQRLEPFGSLTARESIGLAASIDHRHRRGQTPVDVDQIVARLGLGRVVDVRTDMLPTGQGRLVELGRALAIRPRLLLLDEPASGLDDAETEQLAMVLRELAESGIGILLVEHDMGLVMETCSMIHVLDHGVLISSGSPPEIRTHPQVRASYLGDEPPPRQTIPNQEVSVSEAPSIAAPASEAPASVAPASDRLDRLRADLAAGHVGEHAGDRDTKLARFGGLLLAAGVLTAVVAYFVSHRTTDPLIQNDAIVIAMIGMTLAVAGGATYVRHGIASVLRARDRS